MDAWLHWARGPLFWSALAFMLLGLVREVGLITWGAIRTWRRAGDRRIPTRQVVAATLKWLLPVDRLRNRWPYSVTTFVLHVAVIVVPLFLAGHIALWKKGIGLSWPALPNTVATTLTLVAIVAAAAVVVQRASFRVTRSLSRFQDYALPLLLALGFASGFLVMHPAWNPFAADPTLLTHVLVGDALLFLVPLTKLSHMILLPFTQLVSELAWHFPPDAGKRVGLTLGKENEPV
jgi:hypothetical protein